MKGLLRCLLMGIGGAIGWWAGDFVGLMTAVLLSSAGTGAGLWAAIRIERGWGL